MSGKQKLYFLGIMLLAAAARLWGLDERSLWLDEATSLSVSGQALGAVLAGAGFDRHTPPFYYLLLHLWFQPLDISVWNLRLFSLCFDLLNTALLMAAALQLTTPAVALRAGFLWAISPFAVYYGQEGRMYALLATLVLAGFWLAARLERGKFRLREMLLLAIVAVCGLYTHYYFALAFAAITLAVLTQGRSHPREVGLWIAACFIAGVAFLPWLKIIVELAGSGGQSFRTFTATVIPYALFRFGAGYGVFPFLHDTKQEFLKSVAQYWPEIVVYCSVFGAAVIGGAWLLWRQQPRSSRIVLLPLFFPGIVALLVSFKVPMLSERYLIVSLPFFLLAVAYFVEGPNAGKRRRIFGGLIIVLTLFGLWQHHFNPLFGNTQWDEAAQIVRESESEKVVVINPDYAADVLKFYLPDAAIVSKLEQAPPSSSFWLVERGTADPALAQFTERGWEVEKQILLPKENGIRLALFRRAQRAAQPSSTSPDED